MRQTCSFSITSRGIISYSYEKNDSGSAYKLSDRKVYHRAAKMKYILSGCSFPSKFTFIKTISMIDTNA